MKTTLILTGICSFLSATAAPGQCSGSSPALQPDSAGTGWKAIGGFEGVDGGDFEILSMATIGTDLYVCGGFTNVAGVPGTANIAKWDGTRWSSLGTGLNDYASVLLAKGNELYVGGSFTMAGGVPANGIVKWNGSSWTPLGEGVSGYVEAMVFSGQDLYVGGSFGTAGGKTANDVAKWSDGKWTALGGGFDGAVYALAFFKGDLYAGGRFSKAGGRTVKGIARWNGSAWSPVEGGVGDQDYPRQSFSVTALAAHRSGLYVGGFFTEANGDARMIGVAKWNGSSWSRLGSGLRDKIETYKPDEDEVIFYKTAGVLDLALAGDDLYAGGFIRKSGSTSLSNIAKWNGETWQSVSNGTNDAVQDLHVAGGNLYAAGYFTRAGGGNAVGLAQISLPAKAEIAVEQPRKVSLTNGKTKSSFGKVKVGRTSKSKSFIIRNVGAARLTGIEVALGGPHRRDFVVTRPLESLPPGGSTSITVRFRPKAAGDRTAFLKIASSDQDENPFSIQLSGIAAK